MINQLSDSSYSSKYLEHLNSQTVRARELKLCNLSFVTYQVPGVRSHMSFFNYFKEEKINKKNLQAVGTKWCRVCYQWSLLRPFLLTRPQGRVSQVVVMSVCLCVCHKRCNCQIRPKCQRFSIFHKIVCVNMLFRILNLEGH